MSRLRANQITNQATDGAPTVEKGLVISGVTTSTSFSGNLTGNASTATIASGITTTASINTSGIVTATSFVPTTGQLSHRNIAINGDMRVAQRGSSSTTSGYATVDRFKVSYSGTDEAPTQAQVDVASGTTPYTLGFRKALKITNGDQTGGAGAADFITYAYRVEAQDMASSGWNYTSASSFITLSFWIKSSVAQSFGCFVRTHDGNQLTFPFETGSLSPDTWTKIIKIIPGNGAMSFSYDNGTGLEIIIGGFWGTDYTTSNKPLDTWGAYSNGSRLKDNTPTWYTTNDSTLEITGLQLEVGSVATPFEHRSIGEELIRCKRYFEIIKPNYFNLGRFDHSNGQAFNFIQFQVTKRNSPTASTAGTFRSSQGSSGNISFDSTTVDGASIYTSNTTGVNGILYILDDLGNGTLMLKFDAEL